MDIFPKKKLGFGLMRLPLTDPDDGGSIDIEQCKKMVDRFMERGFTYFDTAWMYCDFRSENAVKEFLVDRYPRGSFTLTTKLHSRYFDTKDGPEEIFNEQLRKTGAGYFDYYFIHNIGKESYQKYTELGCFEWLKQKKASGAVRHIGFSFHDTAEMLDKVLTEHPEMEFVQLQLNYLDWESSAIQSRLCYETAERHGKNVIVMEPVKGGTLAKVPGKVEQAFREVQPEMSVASWGIRFAASLPNVKVVLSGMSSLEQMEDNTGFMSDFVPMSEREVALCHKAAEAINDFASIPCTGCAYCVPGCPMSIPIPRCFALYNAEIQQADNEGWKSQGQYYERLTMEKGKAGSCISCGQCENVCPQHLPIREHLRTVSKYFDGKSFL